MFVGHTLAANEHVDTHFHLIFAVGIGLRPGVGQTPIGATRGLARGRIVPRLCCRCASKGRGLLCLAFSVLVSQSWITNLGVSLPSHTFHKANPLWP